MRKGMKRLAKRVLKMSSLFVLVGVGVIVGIVIGLNTADAQHTVIIRSDAPSHFSERVSGDDGQIQMAIDGQMIEPQIQKRIVENIVVEIPPIPTIPPMPEIQSFSDGPPTVHIDRAPSFFEVVNGIGTVLASLGLIGLGISIIVRGRREPKEKSPESLNL